jgi:hypothetical protein
VHVVWQSAVAVDCSVYCVLLHGTGQGSPGCKLCVLQVLLSRLAAKLGSSLQPQHAAIAAGVLAAAAADVTAQLPQLDPGARRDIAAAVVASGRHRRLIKSALHAIVAGSSR